jgi:hypothetical protein
MSLTPLDSTTIYPINPVIYHPLIALWPAKIKTLAFTFAFSFFPSHDIQAILFHIPRTHHFTRLTYSYISNKNVSPQWLSLITKTRIRGLDASNLPFLVIDDNHAKEWYKKGFVFWNYLLFSRKFNKRIEWMSPKQRNRENSPYICAYNFRLISTHMHRYSNSEFPLQNRDQGNNYIYITKKKLSKGLASRLYKN